MKRRKFLANSFAVGAFAAIGPGAAIASAATRSEPVVASSTTRFNQAWFEKLVNTRFSIERPDGAPIDARLVAVTKRDSCEQTRQFSLVFHLPQHADAGGLCWVSHPTEGRFQLYLDKACRVGAVNACQAQFNLIA